MTIRSIPMVVYTNIQIHIHQSSFGPIILIEFYSSDRDRAIPQDFFANIYNGGAVYTRDDLRDSAAATVTLKCAARQGDCDPSADVKAFFKGFVMLWYRLRFSRPQSTCTVVWYIIWYIILPLRDESKEIVNNEFCRSPRIVIVWVKALLDFSAMDFLFSVTAVFFL